MIMMADRKKTVQAILGPHPEAEEKEEPSSLQMCAEELIDAVHSKDAHAVVDALKAMFEELDSEPHVEGPHIGE